MIKSFNEIYGWYMTFYSNGKSTPILTQIVDAIGIGSFFTPFISHSTAGQSLPLNLFLGIIITGSVIMFGSLIVAFIGYLKIRYRTTAKELEINTRQNPIIMQMYHDIAEIKEKIKVLLVLGGSE